MSCEPDRFVVAVEKGLVQPYKPYSDLQVMGILRLATKTRTTGATDT